NDGHLGARGVVAEQPVEENEPVTEEPRRQEVAADVLLAAQSTLPRLLWIPQDLDARFGALARRVDEPAGLAVLDLGDDPAHTSCDRRPRLPQRLGHRQPESLADRLLHDGG